MNRRRIAIGVSSVSGLAVVAAGAMSMFGSGGSANAVDLHAAPAAAVSNATGATVRAQTSQLDTVVTIAIPALPAQGKTPATPAQTLTMQGSGAFDFAKKAGSVDLTLPTGRVNEVLTPSTVWMRRSAAAATASAAAVPASPWSPTSTAASPDGSLFTDGATGPAMIFAMLGGVQPGVREVGQDVVRGVPVAHYTGTLDLAQAASVLSDAAPEKRPLSNAARSLTTTKVPFDAYLDAQGRLRRFVGSFSYREGGATNPVVRATSATELYGFGIPVTVVVPTAAPTTAARPAAHPTSPTRPHK